jgi:tRNA A-37 threonylcarbamoyl transferase component Bud32
MPPAQQVEVPRAEMEYNALVQRYLPVGDSSSTWRSSERRSAQLQHQGWKIHVSATVLSASEALRRTADVLGRRPIDWKGAASLGIVAQLNSGIVHGYSQIGKIFTIYSGDVDSTRELGEELADSLAGIDGPRIPFDEQFRDNSVVYYRYGVLVPTQFVEVDGARYPALVDPDGALIVDRRGSGLAVPSWVQDLNEKLMSGSPGGPLATRYITYEAIVQRGKGGTYRAIDFGNSPVTRCVVREGRRHGETDWEGLDGAYRVRHEVTVLQILAEAGLRVPRVLDEFRWSDNQYAILEYLNGPDLATFLRDAQEPFDAEALVDLGRQAVQIVADLHAAGWGWRDCKTTNFVVTDSGLYAVDFEGACPLDARNLSPWGSPGHVPPEWSESSRPEDQDLFALGTVLDSIFSKLEEQEPEFAALGRRIASDLRSAEPSMRPRARRLLSVF